MAVRLDEHEDRVRKHEDRVLAADRDLALARDRLADAKLALARTAYALARGRVADAAREVEDLARKRAIAVDGKPKPLAFNSAEKRRIRREAADMGWRPGMTMREAFRKCS